MRDGKLLVLIVLSKLKSAAQNLNHKINANPNGKPGQIWREIHSINSIQN